MDGAYGVLFFLIFQHQYAGWLFRTIHLSRSFLFFLFAAITKLNLDDKKTCVWCWCSMSLFVPFPIFPHYHGHTSWTISPPLLFFFGFGFFYIIFYFVFAPFFQIYQTFFSRLGRNETSKLGKQKRDANNPNGSQ